MKLGIDLHGVITDIPETMIFLAKAVFNAGGEVHVITGGSTKKAEKELHELGFYSYTCIFSVLDYHIEIETPVRGYNYIYGNPEFSNTEWDRTKGDYCKRENIDIMIDDSLIYNEYFSTPFARLWTHTGTPKHGKTQRHQD